MRNYSSCFKSQKFDLKQLEKLIYLRASRKKEKKRNIYIIHIHHAYMQLDTNSASYMESVKYKYVDRRARFVLYGTSVARAL